MSTLAGLAKAFRQALDPVEFARACGIDPDPVQAKLLRSTASRVAINACRQFGKSTITACVGLHAMVHAAPTTVVLVSPSMPQSTELFRKLHTFWQRLPGAPEAVQESATRLELKNGSRCISLPGTETSARGYTADLIIMDEASRVSEELVTALRPMMATKSDARFLMLSTPAGQRGYFYETWTNASGWERISVKGSECPRISAQFLREELEALGPMQFAQEYCCEFIDNEASAFATDLIQAAFVDDFEPFLAPRSLPVEAAL